MRRVTAASCPTINLHHNGLLAPEERLVKLKTALNHTPKRVSIFFYKMDIDEALKSDISKFIKFCGIQASLTWAPFVTM